MLSGFTMDFGRERGSGGFKKNVNDRKHIFIEGTGTGAYNERRSNAPIWGAA
jgi:hypothetical protein